MAEIYLNTSPNLSDTKRDWLFWVKRTAVGFLGSSLPYLCRKIDNIGSTPDPGHTVRSSVSALSIPILSTFCHLPQSRDTSQIYRSPHSVQGQT